MVDRDCHPQTIAVLKTRAESQGLELIIADPFRDLEDLDFFALILQYPGSSGEIRDFGEAVRIAHAKAALVTVAADLLSLVLLKPPAAFDADIVVGSAQRFGVPMGLRRTACGFFRHPRRIQTRHARTYHRRFEGQPRQPLPTAWRCKPANSISAATKPPAISALPKRC